MNHETFTSNSSYGSVHSFETLGALDGPGLRTVVFLAGCPMRCRYCHNPDTWNAEGAMRMSADEVFEKIRRMKPYFGENGGVTISGGEPLLQTEFVTEIFKRCKADAIHTALDTSGAICIPQTKQLLELSDLVLCDIKHSDKDKFYALTKYPMDHLLSFLDLCKAMHKRLWLRSVIVPGLTDDLTHIKNLKRIANDYGAEKVELLPYHTHGIYKWEELNIPYTLKGVNTPTQECMKELEKIITNPSF